MLEDEYKYGPRQERLRGVDLQTGRKGSRRGRLYVWVILIVCAAGLAGLYYGVRQLQEHAEDRIPAGWRKPLQDASDAVLGGVKRNVMVIGIFDRNDSLVMWQAKTGEDRPSYYLLAAKYREAGQSTKDIEMDHKSIKYLPSRADPLRSTADSLKEMIHWPVIIELN